MVFYTPPLQSLPTITAPPVRKTAVGGVAPVDQRKQRDGRAPREKRTLRQRLIDLVMEEVEELPDLSSPQKQRIRDSLGRFSDQHAQAPVPPPPSRPSAQEAVELMAGVLTDPDGTSDGAVGTDSLALVDGTPEMPMGAEGAGTLADQMRRLLTLNTERAVKIATYVHALMAVTPESHQVDVDI